MILKSKKMIMFAVIAVIIVAVPVSYYYNTYQKSQPLPQIGVQAFNRTSTYNANMTSLCSGNRCVFLPVFTAFSNVSDPGYKNSSITLNVLSTLGVFNDLCFRIRVWINGSLPSNLKPSGLIIKQSIESPDVPDYVQELKGGLICSSYTNNTNISLAKYPADYPSAYTCNASANATMNIDESFTNDSLPSNTTLYHFSSYVFLHFIVNPLNVNNASAHNWRLFDLLPVNFTTGITITGLSQMIQEHVQIDVLKEGS